MLGFTTDGGMEAIRARAGALKALFLLGADEMDLSAFATPSPSISAPRRCAACAAPT
jgi:hypothetical protein